MNLSLLFRGADWKQRQSALHFLKELRDGFRIRRFDDPLLGDDRGDEFRGGDVEGGIDDVDLIGGDLRAAHVRDLPVVALLDGDAATVGHLRVDRGDGQADGGSAGREVATVQDVLTSRCGIEL